MSTSAPRSDFIQTLQQRGFFHQCSDLGGVDALAAAGKLVGYIGFDCTAASFHIGNLIQIMVLHWLQQSGNKPIVLMGGGTTRIGDPSGRDETRKLLTSADISANKDRLKGTFAKLIKFGAGPADALMADNDEWLAPLNYIEFLRDVGRHMSVNRMLSFDSVRTRLERQQEMSFIEFNYSLLQAYDFVELHRRYGCNMQMGGSDQWGNIVSGIDLGRRMGTSQLYCVTTRLITTASGAKMGKTAAGSVWLNADMLSPYDFWQFWRNCEDADVGRFMRLFTTMPLTEIARYDTLSGNEINEGKKALATAVTTMVHGASAAAEAAETARKTFEEGGTADTLPTVEIDGAELAAGLGVLGAFVKAGLVASNGEARRQVQGGGLRVNDIPVTDPAQLLTGADAVNAGAIKLSMGRKKHVLLRGV